MKYLQILFLLLLAIPAVSQSRAGKQPNIILIMADDLGYEALGTYGNDQNATPHLDSLAASGMLFENCHSNPLCTPSRVQIMTGKYNFRNYIGFGLLDPGETTFAHLLREAGYETCITGKWQLYGYQRQWELAGGRKGTLPADAGFDHYRLWQVRELGSRYKSPTLDTRGTGLKTYPGGYAPDLFADYIEEFLDTRDNDKPFFVYYPMCLTHSPFEPTPFSDDFAGHDPLKKKVNDPKYFGAMVEYMDHLVGRIVQKVKTLGIEENTLIIFTGDNGTGKEVVSYIDGTPFKGGKGQTNDLGTHVPLIASWPGHIKAGSVNTDLIDFTDFLPTFLDVSGYGEKKQGLQLDGVSFYPLLTGNRNRKDKRKWIFCHYEPNWGRYQKRRFVYNKEWKLYESGEIYHLRNDIRETRPLKKSELDRKSGKVIDEFEIILSKMQ